MKPAAYGALALIVWTVVVFFVGRATIPDRSAEVTTWRDSAQAVLQRSVARETERAADSARGAAAVARAEAAEARLASARSVAREQQARTAALEVELAEVATLVDTARVQAAIIVSQQKTILGLSVSLADAQEFLRDARMDLAKVNEEGRAKDREEIRELRATIAAGIGATKPSRGTSRTWQTLALGIGIGVVGWELVR